MAVWSGFLFFEVWVTNGQICHVCFFCNTAFLYRQKALVDHVRLGGRTSMFSVLHHTVKKNLLRKPYVYRLISTHVDHLSGKED